MSESFVAEALGPVLASHYLLHLKTQNYHWNVTGPAFFMLHEVFEKQYRAMNTAIDIIAERIRALGQKAPASFALYSRLSSIGDGDSHADAMQMVRDLVESHLLLIGDIERALDVADKAKDVGSADLLTERLVEHQSMVWQLGNVLL